MESKHYLKEKCKWNEVILNRYTLFSLIKSHAKRWVFSILYQKTWVLFYFILKILRFVFWQFLLVNCNYNLITHAPDLLMLYIYIHVVILFHGIVNHLFIYHWVPILRDLYLLLKIKAGNEEGSACSSIFFNKETLSQEPQNIDTFIYLMHLFKHSQYNENCVLICLCNVTSW